MRHTHLITLLLVGSAVMSATAIPAHAASPSGSSLVITNEPLPSDLRRKIYNSPVQPVNIDSRQVSGPDYYDTQSTAVQTEVAKIASALQRIQGRMGELSGRSLSIKQENQRLAAQYYSSVATINTQLQTGTTPGNPRLVRRLNDAQRALDQLSSNANNLNSVAVGLASISAEANVLLENARAAYHLTGAVEEDHLQLAQMEDQVSNNMVTLDRLQNGVADDIARTNAYLASEMSNLRTMSLAVTTGDFFNSNITGRSSVTNNALHAGNMGNTGGGMMPVSTGMAPVIPPQATVYDGYAPMAPSSASYNASSTAYSPSRSSIPYAAEQEILPPPDNEVRAPSARPIQEPVFNTNADRMASADLPPAMAPVPAGHTLAKVKFDKENINFAGPVYSAMNDALAKYPNARFQIVAVAPSSDNAAADAIANSKAKRNAEKVLQAVTEMGIPTDRVALTTSSSGDVQDNEVHVVVR